MEVVPTFIDVELPEVGGRVDNTSSFTLFADGVREACARTREDRIDGVAASCRREDAIAATALSDMREAPTRPETAQNPKINHPLPSFLETSRVDGV